MIIIASNKWCVSSIPGFHLLISITILSTRLYTEPYYYTTLTVMMTHEDSVIVNIPDGESLALTPTLICIYIV